MARIICYLDDKFFEYTTVADGPCSDLMSEQEFREYSLRMYGEIYMLDPGPDGFEDRIHRAKKFGHSRSLPNDHKTLEDFITANMGEYRTYNEQTDDFVLDKWRGMEAFKKEWFSEDTDEPVVKLGDPLHKTLDA